MRVKEVNNAQLAAELGVAASTIGQWINRGSKPDWKSLRALAMYFDRPFSEVLIRAGIATEEELNYVAPSLDPNELSNAQLLAILSDRLDSQVVAKDSKAVSKKAETVDEPPRTKRYRRGPTNR